MSDVTQLISEAGSAHEAITAQTRQLAGKWETSGLLEGLSGAERQGMAVMLENQAGQLLKENSKTNPSGGDNENWAGVALPLVRKVFGSIAAKNFVSVQPMNLPAGLVFFMDFKYGSATAGRSVGDSLYGTQGTSGFTDFDNTDSGGLYGAGRFGYSVNESNAIVTSVASASVGWADIDFDNRFNTSSLLKFTVTSSTAALPNADFLAARSFTPSGSADWTTLLREFTKYDASANTLTFVVDNTAGASTGDALLGVDFSLAPTETSRGDFEDRDGTDLAIPQIDLELKSETIVAKTRKLKAVWSPELAQARTRSGS
jgi:hypothetical protein